MASSQEKEKTEIRQETSVLDLFLVCDRILPLVVKMNVDKKGIHQLSNFSGIQHNSKVTESDHAIVEMHIDIAFSPIKPTRKEFFNYKNPEGQSRFVHLTSNSRKLSACFENELTFRESAFCLSRSVFKLLLVSAHIKRFSASCMRYCLLLL